MPFDPTPGPYIGETIAVLESLDLSAADKTKIYSTNAAALLGLRI